MAGREAQESERQAATVVTANWLATFGFASRLSEDAAMTCILLTGAGFSRNWGGWLANEAFEYLLGCPEVDAGLRNRLWKSKENKGGFEETLAELQDEFNDCKDDRTEKPLNDLQRAIFGMFTLMDQAFEQPVNSPTQFFEDPIQSFLGRFDAIFTLNQDLLLERRYPAHDGSIGGAQGRYGLHMPGTKLLDPRLNTAPHIATKTEMRVLAIYPGEFKEEAGLQPYYKLHGSINWIGPSEGLSRLLIMGGNKAGAIKQYRLLSWYQEKFAEYLARPGAP